MQLLSEERVGFSWSAVSHFYPVFPPCARNKNLHSGGEPRRICKVENFTLRKTLNFVTELNRRRAIVLLTILLCGLGDGSRMVLAQSHVTGKWTTLPYLMPINPIRVGLLHTNTNNIGKVLVVAGSENDPNKHLQGSSKAAVWDVSATNPLFTILDLSWDVFCNGGTFLADGRCIVVGGTVEYDPFYGDPRMTVFDPVTAKFNQLHSMAHGRWYATAITLGDGRALAFSGLDENGNTNSTIEIYRVASGWTAPNQAPFTPPLYPWLHLLPDGRVFYSGSSSSSHIFNPSTQTWATNVATTFFRLDRTYGNSVLLPLLPQNGYAAQVMILGGGSPTSTDTTEIIDLSKTPLAWADSGKMSRPRVQGNSVLLPNGKVLALGGSAQNEDVNSASLPADLYDPVSKTWSSAGIAAYARLYHSVALLLPDATVAVAGSNPQRGTYEQHIEIYSPPYLFDASDGPAIRPVITGAPANIGYGTGNFVVQTPNSPGDVSSVVLVKPGSTTHAFDMEQRVVGLAFAQNSGMLAVNLPTSPNIAPPGYYMLFLLNNAGVPSLATFVQVTPNPGDQPPKGTITSPATDPLNVTVNQPVNFAATANDPDGPAPTTYSWYFPAGNPTTSTALNPQGVKFSSTGKYVASLTVVDNMGVNDPSPPTRTIVVQPSQVIVTITTPAPNSTVKGTVSVNVSVQGSAGNPNTFTFSVDGTALSTKNVNGTETRFTWNSRQQRNGQHTLSVSVTDVQGNSGTASETVTVQN
jgi:galactose oxidase-like protein/glyoxal oxidase-like protein/Big-like domain-containing protein/PKD domain-containing protein